MGDKTVKKALQNHSEVIEKREFGQSVNKKAKTND